MINIRNINCPNDDNILFDNNYKGINILIFPNAPRVYKIFYLYMFILKNNVYDINGNVKSDILEYCNINYDNEAIIEAKRNVITLAIINYYSYKISDMIIDTLIYI